jgi:hypothetical protein
MKTRNTDGSPVSELVNDTDSDQYGDAKCDESVGDVEYSSASSSEKLDPVRLRQQRERGHVVLQSKFPSKKVTGKEILEQ